MRESYNLIRAGRTVLDDPLLDGSCSVEWMGDKLKADPIRLVPLTHLRNSLRTSEMLGGCLSARSANWNSVDKFQEKRPQTLMEASCEPDKDLHQD